ncbi:VTT domain-containing protein [Ruegeria sp. ANG-S4]|uniref:VTT domain-containing protein n=1 Tax=Ruegeria sp. ANG-S4 TaxID=1577904 RepID=UPI0009E1D060
MLRTKAPRITERFGAYVVVVARFFILLRQLNGLVAGATGMPWQTFVLANAIGSLLWVSFCVKVPTIRVRSRFVGFVPKFSHLSNSHKHWPNYTAQI